MNKNQTDYSFNQVLLYFKDSATELAFNRGRYQQDRQAVKFVLGFATVLSILYLIFDIYRYTDKIDTLIYRGGLALSLLTFLFVTNLLNPQKPKQLQAFAFFIAMLTAVVGYLQNLANPQHELFLSNFLSSGIFLSSTILGIRFRYLIPLTTSFVISYFVYIHLNEYGVESKAFTQIPQLLTFWAIGLISCYLLDKQRMMLFIKEQILQIQYDTVDNLNNVKDKLFSTISHDIRGPIMNLKGVTELFKKSAISQEELTKLVGSLDLEIGKTSNLIDNLLAWSKSQLQGIDINKTTYSIKLQILEIVALFSTQISDKGLSLQLNIEENDQVFADKEMMLIVFRNLISNSIKFTPFGGDISISGKEIPEDKCYSIKIKDSGGGIESEKIQDLFKMEKSLIIGSSVDKGAGLGLTLVKDFVDRNDGEIKCTSKLGLGTEFEIRLPHPTVNA